MFDFKHLGKGALPHKHDPTTPVLGLLAGAPAPIDWNRPFALPEPPDTNQGISDVCVGEGWSSAHWQVKGKRFSVRSIFAYIAQSYGAYIVDGGDRVVDFGQETFGEAPDPTSKTPSNMRSKQGLNPALGLDDKELRIFATGGNPDQMAQAIRDWKGVVFGLSVTSEGWTDLTNPNPPHPNQGGEGHCLYGKGYHLHNGQKCIIAKSSYCGAQPGHHEHHIRHNYFDSGYVFPQTYVLVPKENIPMVRRFKVNDHGKLGVMLITDGAFDAPIFWAKNEIMYERLLADYEVPADAPTITVP